MPLHTDCNDSYRDQIWLAFGFVTVEIGGARTRLTPTHKRQLLHNAPARTIVPSWKTQERDALTRILDAELRIPEFGRQSEMSHPKSRLQPLLDHSPVGWT